MIKIFRKNNMSIHMEFDLGIIKMRKGEMVRDSILTCIAS